ncbi:hypothetical protein F5Y13DRAFT_154104 [Hypoxylon sp. FL1857]|nr:hypothetical protein F5Y13DRAFT_154104 [Hypoxylon sp. FL1857]
MYCVEILPASSDLNVSSSLMPLNILSVEMPLVFRWRWLAFGSMMWSIIRVLYGFVVNLPANLPGWVVFATMFRMAGTSYGLMLPFHNYFGRTRSSLGPLPSLLSGNEAENLYSVHVKAWYHLAYASTLIYGPRGPFHDVPRSAMSTLFRLGPLCASRLFCRMEPATLFSALASLSYWIALWIGQEYVFSRTLGGPGVERMTFIRPGRVSSNDSIGLDEGRIRL